MALCVNVQKYLFIIRSLMFKNKVSHRISGFQTVETVEIINKRL